MGSSYATGHHHLWGVVGRVSGSGMGRHIGRGVAKGWIESWILLHHSFSFEGLCWRYRTLSVLDASKVTLADAPPILARTIKNFMHTSGEGLPTNTWGKRCLLRANITVIATIVPGHAVFWWLPHRICEFCAHRQAFRILASRSRITIFKNPVVNGAVGTAVRPLHATMWNLESVLNDFGWVANSAIAKFKWNVREGEIAGVHGGLGSC